MSAAPGLERRPRRDRGRPTHSEGVSDEALLAAMATGDTTAASVLIRRHQRRVFGIAFAITGDRTSAEDIAQEAFLRVWRHAAVFDAHRATAVTWISTIARNLAIDAIRARRTTPIDPYEGLDQTDGPDDTPSTEEQAVEADLVGRVRGAISLLPEDQRRVLMRSAFYGQSASEIAAAEQIPLGTAKSRIRLALTKVRDALAAEKGAFDGPDA